MNNLFVFITAVSLATAPLAFADDAHHPENTQEKKVTVAKTVVAPAKTAQADQSMPMLHEQMQKMRELMDKIQATTDPKERQQLLHEHTQMMSESMRMMSREGAQGGMKMAMMDGTKSAQHHEKGETENCPMMGDHGMLGKRMDMMQMMMEQMMQHQQVIESPSK